MDCKAVQKVIFRFIYGECDANELKKVQEHLERCDACRQERDIIADILYKIKDGLPDDPVPASLRERVMIRIQEIEADPD